MRDFETRRSWEERELFSGPQKRGRREVRGLPRFLEGLRGGYGRWFLVVGAALGWVLLIFAVLMTILGV